MLGLLLRLADPTSGSVTIDRPDLRDVTQISLRTQLGVVFQDNFLFDTTIRENIRLGRPDATDERIESAARDAGIHDFIMSLPEGTAARAGAGGARDSPAANASASPSPARWSGSPRS